MLQWLRMKTLTFKEAIERVKAGDVGVLPTDTVYGLTARADSQPAVKRLYRLKRRESKPGTIVAASIDQLVQLGLKRRYLTAIEHYWPNPISIIIPCADAALSYLHLGKQSLAVRIPSTQWLSEALHQTGPLLTSSANHPGEKPADSPAEAYEFFGDQADFYTEPMPGMERQSSTVLQIIDDSPVVLRQGAITINEETGEIIK